MAKRKRPYKIQLTMGERSIARMAGAIALADMTWTDRDRMMARAKDLIEQLRKARA